MQIHRESQRTCNCNLRDQTVSGIPPAMMQFVKLFCSCHSFEWSSFQASGANGISRRRGRKSIITKTFVYLQHFGPGQALLCKHARDWSIDCFHLLIIQMASCADLLVASARQLSEIQQWILGITSQMVAKRSPKECKIDSDVKKFCKTGHIAGLITQVKHCFQCSWYDSFTSLHCFSSLQSKTI